jgi:putative ABC transport system permease protein
MLSPRWRKLLRDVKIAKGRTLMMVLAMAIGIFGVGTMLSAYTILTREINVNYMNTTPASAYLEVEDLDESLVQSVRQQPNIAAAEVTAWVDSRIEVRPNEWMPLLLFVVSDFNSMRINTFQPENGAFPPTGGSILLERTALPLLNMSIGSSPRIQTPNGQKQNVTISGTVHDPSLAPAWQEQTAYGFISPDGLQALGEDDPFHILKVIVKDQPYNLKTIDRTVSDLADWLKQQGYSVEEIRIPPPGKHPHSSQMTGIIVMLLIFSFMALLLSAILTATIIGAMLAGQVRQIGMMKAIGARTWQIAGLYLTFVFIAGLVAAIIGIPLGISAGSAFAGLIADLLNFTLYSAAVPLWVYLSMLLLGILVPLFVALIPIMKSTRVTVREAINDFGTSRKTFGSRKLDLFLGKIRILDRTLILALRNTFRRRGRLLLTLLLLSSAGGMFITSLNVKSGWERVLSIAASNRHYDLEIRLNQDEPEEKTVSMIQSVPGVKQVEVWNLEPAGAHRPDGLNIVKTYPDGGHGSFNLRSLPAETKMGFSLMEGRLLQQSDPGHAVVLNHTAHALFPNIRIGDSLPLDVNEKLLHLQVVGIVREYLTPAAAYVSSAGFAEMVGTSGRSNALRVILNEHDPANRLSVIKEIERSLEQGNIKIKAVISEDMLDEAVTGHVYILIFALLFMSVLMAVVGGLGLMSTMGTSVVERTREFGIMRTIGGQSGMVLRNVISEGIFIGLMSWIIAILISIPISQPVGKLIGELAFRSPLPFILSPVAVVVWLVIMIAGAALASAYPAWKASKLTIRDALDYI